MKSNFSKDESEKEEFAKIESENTSVPCYDRFGYIGATIVQKGMFELDTANGISAGQGIKNRPSPIQVPWTRYRSRGTHPSPPTDEVGGFFFFSKP